MGNSDSSIRPESFARKVLRIARAGHLPWKLRWILYLHPLKPILSLKLILASLIKAPSAPCLMLQIFGQRFLQETLQACSNVGIRPFLAFGTLLGHCREGGFIKHDADIDLGLLEYDIHKIPHLTRAMQKMGYVVRISNDHEVSFYKPHFPTLFVDFFVFYKKHDRAVYYDTRGDTKYEFFFPIETFDEWSEVKFLGHINVLIPKRAEEFLTSSYGDWRTPKKDFDNVHDHPNIRVL